jgi:indolepyruvate decarboxylase
MVNPVAAAYAEKVPVVVISGGPGVREKNADLLLHHQAKRLDSQFQIFREITCAQTRLDDLERAAQELSRVLSSVLVQSRPGYIEVPRDLVAVPCGGTVNLDVCRNCDLGALEACVDEVLAALNRARSPMLMVGVEIKRLGIESPVAELARRLGIPVVTSFMGRGLLALDDVPLLGTYMGMAGDPTISDLVEDSDGLMLLGVILSDTNFGASRRKLNFKHCILANDGEVSLGYHTYSEIPLDYLVRGLLRRLDQVPWTRRNPISNLERMEPLRRLTGDDEPLAPDDISRGINDLLHKVGPHPIVADVGDALFIAMDIEHAELAAPGYYASMGFAVPAGLGLCVAMDKRPIILVGDGAFQMTGWELGNCRRYGWNPIVVVLNNRGWEMLRAFAPQAEFNNLPEWKFAELGQSLGCRSRRVATRREWQAALHDAECNPGQPVLIEVLLPRGATSRRMSQYVGGLLKPRVAAESASG